MGRAEETAPRSPPIASRPPQASVTLLSAGGVPPLHAAAAAGAVEVIELLVARGAPLKMPDDRRQCSPPLPVAMALRATLTAAIG